MSGLSKLATIGSIGLCAAVVASPSLWLTLHTGLVRAADVAASVLDGGGHDSHDPNPAAIGSDPEPVAPMMPATGTVTTPRPLTARAGNAVTATMAPAPGGLFPPYTGQGVTFTFQRTLPDGTPVRFDCAAGPVTYRIAGPAPDGAQRFVDRAVDHLSAATGLDFRAVEPADGIPSKGGLDPHDRTITISWVDEDDYDRLGLDRFEHDSSTVGMTSMMSTGGTIDADHIWLSTDRYDMLPLTIGHGDAWETILHELGHAVGLGHSPKKHSVMSPVSDGTIGNYTPADDAGLHLVGGTWCAT